MTVRQQPLIRWIFSVSRAVVRCGLAVAISCVATAENQPAVNYLVHNWDVDEGLPSTCINAVVRTPDGYVWLATRHGLARFDGLRFIVFNWENTPVLKDNRIMSLVCDQQGVLWIGTESGDLSKFDHGIFTSVNLGNATHGQRISSMTADAEGNLWLATDGAGLIRTKGGQTETFTPNNGILSLNLWQVLADSQGRIWYVATTGKLGWIEQGKCRVPESAAALPASIRTIALAQDGGLWLASQNKHSAGTWIYKFKDGLITEDQETPPWPQNSWRSRPGALLEDQSGNLWCGTLGGGVFFRPADGQWQKLVADQPFSHAETMCLVEDKDASIWIGTRTSGLHLAVPRPMNTYFLPADNNQNVLLTICVRHDGSIWGGTDGAGVFCWQNPATNRFGEPQGLAGQQVNCLLEDSHSNFWAGTSAGLFRFQEGMFKPLPTAGHAPVNALYEDADGILWAGTTSGLFSINASKNKKYDWSNRLTAGSISSMVKDSSGRFWVAVQGQGVFWQNGDRFEPWLPKSGAEESRQRWNDDRDTRYLLAAADGSIWVATHGGGLFRLDGDQIRQWNWEKDGLPSNHHFALMNDDAGNLWVSSEMGIFGYNPNALLNYQSDHSLPVPWRLTQADGLPYKVCSGGSQPTASKSADGRLWFPDGSALVVFDPANLLHHSPTWPPVIEEVREDGQPQPVPTANSIQMMSGVRSLELYFTSPNTLLPTKLRFRYRLDGLDKDWIAAGIRRSAQYSRLPPGDYTFRVMVCDNYGVWNEQEAALLLTVVPHFWETKWFQAGVGLFLLAGAGLAARQIERAHNRRKLATLEHERALERERSRIARDIHDDLGASLTEVALLGDMAGDNSGSPEELREQTQKISTAAREMTQSLEAIVWAVRPENDSLRSLVEYMNRRTDELFEKMPRQYQFVAPSELPECSIHAEVRHNVFLAYKEALTNSLKYAKASMVRIEIACDIARCRIMIADNGTGFDPGSVRASGTGLKNMRQRMAEIGGEFELESQPGHGTTVRLQFPLPRQNPN